MAERSSGHLRRVMKFRDLVLFYITAVVGLRWIARAAEEGPAAFPIWAIACAALFIPLAFTVLELSSRHPDEGGIYVWSKRAFGDFAGFITGWNYWASNLVYFPGLLYFAAGNALYVSDGLRQRYSDSPWYFMGFALAGIAIAVATNVVGLGVGKWVANLGAISTWVLVLTIVVMGAVAFATAGSATAFPAAAFAPRVRDAGGGVDWSQIAFWSTIAFAFGGLESASTMAGEVHDARRSIPRAIVVAGLMITALYVVGTLSILVAIPAREVSGIQAVMQAVSATTEHIGLGFVAPAFALLIAVATLGTVTAWIAATARIPFVAGIDNFLPAAFARVHPRWNSPYVALVVQGALAAAFAVLGQAGTTVKGAYDVLVSMGVIAYFIPYLFMFAAMVKAQRGPDDGGSRVPGGRPVGAALGALGFLTTAASIYLACLPSKDSANPAGDVVKIVGASAALVAVGAVVYAAGTARRARRAGWAPRRRKGKRRKRARR